jgi:predicted  nucleic acid-binding Zn-ribbon protein
VKAPAEDQSRLIELQLIDNALMQSKNKLRTIPEREQILAIQVRLKNAAEELVTVEAELADVSIDLRRSENDVEQVSDRIAKDEFRLGSGNASPKELESLQHEMVSLAKRKSELEDTELEIMLRHESVTARAEELKSDQVGLQKLELELNIRIENSVTEIEKEITSKTQARNELLPGLAQPLIDLYEKIRASNFGIGAALLVGNMCKGCNLAINAVEADRIKTLAADEVLRCEECRTILVRI